MRRLIKKLFRPLPKQDEGATAVEYGLLLSLMVLALIAALGSTGDQTKEKWDGVSTDIVEATQAAAS